jgi:hypothetical protein
VRVPTEVAKDWLNRGWVDAARQRCAGSGSGTKTKAIKPTN